jgi:fucose permease
MAVDLDLGGYRFNIALTIFYIGYFIVEIPSNIILKKVGAKLYLPLMVVAFGIVSMCTGCKAPLSCHDEEDVQRC